MESYRFQLSSENKNTVGKMHTGGLFEISDIVLVFFIAPKAYQNQRFFQMLPYVSQHSLDFDPTCYT